jgi:hypothetical protein
VFWLIKVVSLFLLVVLGLTLIFIAPLVSLSYGRTVAQDAAAYEKELANMAAGKGKIFAKDDNSKAVESSSKAHKTS